GGGLGERPKPARARHCEWGGPSRSATAEPLSVRHGWEGRDGLADPRVRRPARDKASYPFAEKEGSSEATTGSDDSRGSHGGGARCGAGSEEAGAGGGHGDEDRDAAGRAGRRGYRHHGGRSEDPQPESARRCAASGPRRGDPALRWSRQIGGY